MKKICKSNNFRFVNLRNDKVIIIKGVCTKKQAFDKLKKRGIDDAIYLRK
ncbi:MAG: hypothetical protein KKB88_00485 [Nanoarchaeota archaeon]|nr:hypothetical protein [Nanoarchaeota archaeon]